MADIYARVKVLERKLDWMMTNMRMKVAVKRSELDLESQVFEGSLKEIFALAKAIPEETENG